MGRSTLHARKAGRLAIAGAAACFAISASAVTIQGGTITFRGALVSPPFGLSMHTASAEDNGFSTRRSASGATASVIFTPAPNSSPSADVSLAVDNHRAAPNALGATFTDGSGHPIKADGAGAFHVRPSGGVLSMQEKQLSTRAVTLVTNYH